MTQIAMSKIVVAENPRHIEGVDDFIGTPLEDFPEAYATEVRSLANSIKEHGLINPVTVKDLGGGKKFRLIAGQRRFKACQSLGAKMIDAKSIKGKTESEQVVALVENVHRKDLPPLDVARALDKMRVELKLSKQSSIAEMVGKSQGWVSQHLALLKAHPSVINAMDSGEIGIAAARTISALPNSDQEEALKEAQETSQKDGKAKVSTKSAKRAYTRKKKAKKDQQQTIRPLEERQLEQRADCIKEFVNLNWPTAEDKAPDETESIARMFWDFLMDKERLVIK